MQGCRTENRKYILKKLGGFASKYTEPPKLQFCWEALHIPLGKLGSEVPQQCWLCALSMQRGG